jgi:hypothetical protein
MSEKIENHKEHLALLVAKSNTGAPADIKNLMDYLILYKNSG